MLKQLLLAAAETAETEVGVAEVPDDAEPMSPPPQATRNIEAAKDIKRPIVFLDVSISSAAPRVGFNKDRPLLTVNPRQQWLYFVINTTVFFSFAFFFFTEQQFSP